MLNPEADDDVLDDPEGSDGDDDDIDDSFLKELQILVGEAQELETKEPIWATKPVGESLGSSAGGAGAKLPPRFEGPTIDHTLRDFSSSLVNISA